MLLRDPNDRSPQTQQMLLTQWGQCVNMANSVSDKRISTNNIYITINSALVALMSFTGGWQNCMVACIGLTVSWLWLRSIRSYCKLNAAKYEVIQEIEKQLPAAPLSTEWEILQKDKKYRRLTVTENVLPFVFMLIFVLTAGLSVFFAHTGG